MKNLFKHIYQNQELPEDLETEIMNSFDTLKLLVDITDLFTHKFGKSEIEMHLDLQEGIEKNENDKKQKL